jgi:hypothetical protein
MKAYRSKFSNIKNFLELYFIIKLRVFSYGTTSSEKGGNGSVCPDTLSNHDAAAFVDTFHLNEVFEIGINVGCGNFVLTSAEDTHKEDAAIVGIIQVVSC